MDGNQRKNKGISGDTTKMRDKVVQYILSNAGKLTPEKIKALAEVVSAVGKPIESGPNKIKGEEVNENEILENAPFDLSDVTGVQIDGDKTRKVKIIKQK